MSCVVFIVVNCCIISWWIEYMHTCIQLTHAQGSGYPWRIYQALHTNTLGMQGVPNRQKSLIIISVSVNKGRFFFFFFALAMQQIKHKLIMWCWISSVVLNIILPLYSPYQLSSQVSQPFFCFNWARSFFLSWQSFSLSLLNWATPSHITTKEPSGTQPNSLVLITHPKPPLLH